jgi:hypothetical protein
MNSKSVFNKLTREGKLKKQKTDVGYLNGLLEAARRNFEAADLVRGRVNEAAFKLLYDGLLQISRVILLLGGYVPDDGEQHKTTFFAAGMLLGEDFDSLIRTLQKFRIKRNECVYQPRGLISEKETEAIHRIAREFWKKVREYLIKANPQMRLFDDF